MLQCRSWPKRVEGAKENQVERAKLIEVCSDLDANKEIICREVRLKRYNV